MTFEKFISYYVEIIKIIINFELINTTHKRVMNCEINVVLNFLFNRYNMNVQNLHSKHSGTCLLYVSKLTELCDYAL